MGSIPSEVVWITWAVIIALAIWAVLKRKNVLVMVLIALLLASALYYVIPPGEKTRLGLDLQGGLQVVYSARTSDGKTPSSSQLDQTVAILDRRVNGLGVTESQIQKQGNDEISIALPGIKNAQQALDVIGKTAQLEFYKDDERSRPVGPEDSKEAALKALRGEGVSKAQIEQLRTQGNTNTYSLIQTKPGTNEAVAWYVYKRPPAMSGSAIASANNGYDSSGQPIVTIKFTSSGSQQFQKITRELYNTGVLRQQSQTFAIVLDNVIESDPYIDYTNPDLADGISGSAEISGGNMTVQESKDLKLVLNTGALPVKLEPSYQQQVSATLGKDSLKEGLIAGLIGLGIVLVYMVIYYRFLGLVADLALIVYGVLLWGLFNAIPVTLTLPGIAGMIMTIGVAADANVVIFERIKEEVRLGKTVRSAVQSGYARGFKTILDANILTILTAAVLFMFATAQPKGFALTLMLGVAVSMLTAVLFTHAMLSLLAGFAFFSNPSFMGVRASQIAEPAAKRATTRRRAAAPATPAPAPASEVAVEAPRPSSNGPRRTSTSRKKKRKRR